MKLKRSVWGLLAVAVGCSASVANGDERKVTPSIALQQEYSDNIYFDTRRSQDDFVTTVSPALELSERTERLTAAFKAQLDNALYYDNSDLNATDQDYRGNLRYALSRKANLFAQAGYRQDSRVDRDLGNTGLLQGDSTRQQYTYQVGGDYALSELTAVQLSYGGARDAYADVRLSDYRSQDLSCMLSRDLSSILDATIGRITGDYSTYESLGAEVKNYSATIGAERKLDERFSFFADFGGRYTRSTLDGLQLVPTAVPLVFAVVPYELHRNGTGLTGQAGLSFRGEVSDAKLLVSQGVGGASGRNGATDRTMLRATVGRQLSEKSRMDFMAEYYLNTSTQDEYSVVPIDERTLRLKPRMVYELNRDLSVEAAYMYVQLENRENDTERERNLVWLRLVYQYPLVE